MTTRAAHLDPVDARVLVAIALHWRDHDEGPAWHVLARASGWREPIEVCERLWRLRNSSLVSFTSERRSIRLQPGALALALERLQMREDERVA
ncbi:MAG: hypothetical protein ACRDNM_00825 [Gaiellaceae bacterium]